MLLLYAALICFIQSVLSGITTTPGMQRTYQWQTVTFQWSVAGPTSSYSVYKQISGQLNANANYTLDSQNGVVTLLIWNIQLSDAGNYSLSVTTGTTTQTDAGALLFVYGSPTTFINQTSGGSGQQPATEGDAVELTCTAISTSLPVAYRPTVIYYQWYMAWIGTFVNVSSGPAKISGYDDPVPGYFIKNDGRTLVIESAQYRDTQGMYCYGQEQWSPYRASAWLNLPLKYRPYITSQSPASRKFNANVSDSVSLSFNFQAFPAVTSATNWSFVNTAGHAQDLPIGFLSSSSYSSYCYLSFTLTSIAYYGSYSITLSNSIGATTETFQVLGLGSPDAPSSVRADFVSHYLIAVAWNCMWFNGRQQTTFLQLRSMYNDSIIDSKNTTLYTGCYNSTSTTPFQNGIQPESDYQVRVWSTNDLGSSDVVVLSVRTPKVFKFFVSPNTISFNGNQAVVNFNAAEGKIAMLYVYYCLELTGNCYGNNYYNVNSTAGQITIDNLQSGDVYIFDFTVYGGIPNRNIYYLTMVKGVRVSRNREVVESDEKTSPLLIAVIVLGVLLGVAVLALIGCIIALVISKRRQKTPPINSQQIQTRAVVSTYAPQPTAQPTTQPKNKAYEEDDTYEAVDETHYTALEGQRHG